MCKVCISLLNTWRGEQWTSCQSISTILLTLCTLLCKDPLLNEPGITTSHSDFTKYTKIIEYKNIDIAILKIVNKESPFYLEKFQMFNYIVKENFLKNSEKILKYLENKAMNQQKEIILSTLYSMRVIINYANLFEVYKDTLEICKKDLK